MGGQHLATAALSPGNNTYLTHASVGLQPVRTFGDDDDDDDDNNNNNTVIPRLTSKPTDEFFG